MADTKISALTELAVPPDPTDEFVIVDKSDTSEAASGTDKRILAQTIDQQIAKAATGLCPTGVTYQNFSRYTPGIAVNATPQISGTLRLHAIWLPAGFTVTSISFFSGTTALSLGTSPHFWVALYNNAATPALLRQSTDDTAATWAASTMKTTNLSSTFTTTYTGLHYAGLMIAQTGGTLPTNQTVSVVVATLQNQAPILFGNSTASLTATAPNPAAAITTGALVTGWCGVA